MSEKAQTVVLTVLSIITLIIGLVGLLLVFPMLETNRVEELIRIGFLFLASAMFFCSGLVSLALIKKRKRYHANSKNV